MLQHLLLRATLEFQKDLIQQLTHYSKYLNYHLKEGEHHQMHYGGF